jgi:hypothetical protein
VTHIPTGECLNWSKSQLEYLIALISIIVGPGVTDFAQNVRELVRPSRPTRWPDLPLLWAGNVMLVRLQFWWASFSAFRNRCSGGRSCFCRIC